MIWIGIGIGFLWCFFLWLIVGICRIGSQADENADMIFKQYMIEHDYLAQHKETADSSLHVED